MIPKDIAQTVPIYNNKSNGSFNWKGKKVKLSCGCIFEFYPTDIVATICKYHSNKIHP